LLSITEAVSFSVPFLLSDIREFFSSGILFLDKVSGPSALGAFGGVGRLVELALDFAFPRVVEADGTTRDSCSANRFGSLTLRRTGCLSMLREKRKNRGDTRYMGFYALNIEFAV
jgi:hypothetical protein